MSDRCKFCHWPLDGDDARDECRMCLADDEREYSGVDDEPDIEPEREEAECSR